MTLKCCSCWYENMPHLVNKLFHQLEILRADTLGAVNQKHQVDVGGLAG